MPIPGSRGEVASASSGLDGDGGGLGLGEGGGAVDIVQQMANRDPMFEAFAKLHLKDGAAGKVNITYKIAN
jgi:hypothetical protein